MSQHTNGDKKRKSVAASQYDSLFELPPLNLNLPEIKLDQPTLPEGYVGLLSSEEVEEQQSLGVRYTPGMNIMKEMSEAQGTLNKIGNVLVRGTVGAAVAAVEPFAYLLDVENHIAALQGADRDYDNFLTKGLRGLEESVREDFPIYTGSQEPTIGSSDWWFQNTDQVLRSIGYFLPAGALFKGANIAGKAIFGTAANLTGKSISGSAAASALNAGSALGSATLLNYGEHAVSAARHIEENLEELTNKYIANGLEPGQAVEEARRTLSKQAAEIIQGGRVNILWQSISQANLFRGVSHTRRLGKLKEATKNQGMFDGLKRLGIEATTEGLEEVTTGYQETEAQYKTDLELGKVVPDNRPAFEKFVEHATSYQGITEGLLGALGGGVVGTGVSIFGKKDNIDALEQIKKSEEVLSASLQEANEKIRDLNKKQVREHAIMNALKGTSQNFMDVLETYRNATEEEAKNLGFESNYKELADEYIADAKYIEDVINNELLNPLRGSQAEAFVLVNNKLNEYYALKDIEKYKSNLTELEAQKQKLFEDIENNVEDKDLHEIRNNIFKRAALQRTVQGFENSIQELRSQAKPLTRETNETLAGEVKNLEDAKTRLKQREETLELKVKDYASANEITVDETLDRVSKLESAGDIDAKIELTESLLAAGRIRRKNNALRYQELVSNPELLKQEAEQTIAQEKAEQAKRAASKKAKQQAQKKQQTQAAKKKAKNSQPAQTTQATTEQQAAGGAPLTADSPIVEKESVSPNKVNVTSTSFSSPVFDGEVNNGGEDIESTGDTNLENSRVAPKSFNPYFEIDDQTLTGRQTNSSSSLAFLSVQYREIEIEGVKEKVSTSNTKTEESKLIESSRAMMPNSEVVLKLVNSDNVALTKEELISMPNEDVDNLAVAVYQDGIKSASLHTTDWIEARDSNGRLINTAPGRLEEELQNARNIRRALARSIDQNNEVKTTVVFKGHGKVLPLYQEDSAGNLLLVGNKLQKVNKPIDQALPDVDNIKLGIVDGGEIFTGEFALKEETVIDLKDANYTNGRVVANLPTPNGKIFPTILFVDNVTADQANTIIGAATSFQNNQTETFDTITEQTGIQFGRQGDSAGLHKFVNRYTFARKTFYSWNKEVEDNFEQGAVLVHTPELAASEDGQVQGMLQIINVDQRVMYTNDPLFFKNNPSFVTDNDIREIKDIREEGVAKEAAQLLQGKLVSVQKQNINKKEEFKDVILNLEGAVEDISTHSSYNAFKGQFLKTDINGKNTLTNSAGETEYTYMTQPLVIVDTSFAEQGAVVNESENANQAAEELSFASPIYESTQANENQLDGYKDDAIARAMREELGERFFDTKIISLPMQLEAIGSIFAQYSQNITKANFKQISQFIKNELNKEADSIKINTRRKKALKHLVDNYDAKSGKVTVEGIMLESLAKLDILPQKQGFRSKDLTDAEIDQIFAESLEVDGFTQEDFVKDIYDFEFYKTNKKRTASSSIKLLLSRATKNETTWLGKNFRKAIPYQESYDTIKATLSTVPGTFKDQRAALLAREEESSNPIFKKIAEELDKGSETLRRQFVVAMSGTRLDFVHLKVNPQQLGRNVEMQLVDRYNTTINIKNKWFRNLQSSKLVKTITLDGIPETIINQKEREKLYNNYLKEYKKYQQANQLRSDEFVDVVERYLGEMGMDVPVEGLRFLASKKANAKDRSAYLGRKSKWETHVNPELTSGGVGQGMMSFLFNSFRLRNGGLAEQQLLKISTDKQSIEETKENEEAYNTLLEAEKRGGFIHVTNPYDGPNRERAAYGLLKLTVDFGGALYGDSFRDAKGNLIYPFQNHFGMSRTLADYIQDKNLLNDLLSLSYNKNSVWGQGLQNDDKYLELLMFDSTIFNANATNRKEQGKFLQEITLFNAFANQGNKDAYFFPITTADKDIAPIIKAPRLTNTVENIRTENGKVTDILDPALEQIYNYAIDEYNRIENYKEIEGVNREAYEEGAKYFYMFNYLNAYDPNQENVFDAQDPIEFIRATVKQNVINQINNHIDRLQELGIEEKFLDKRYINKKFGKQSAFYKTKADKLAGAIADYNLNYIVSNNEVVKLFGNDPAHAFKRSKKVGATLKDDIKETLNNYEKRKADLISPASTPQYTMPSVTIATANDSVKDGIKRTDAQEYGTIAEMVESKLSAGKLPKDIGDKILSAYNAAKNDPDNVRNFFKLNEVLTKEEIGKYKKIMMADKPVFVQNDIRVDQDSNNKLFRKSHIRYLWPEETTGYGLDNIRVAMENSGIDRLGHMTSDKTGAVNPINIYDANGKVRSLPEVTAEMERGRRSISRSGLGIQQEKGTDTGEISYSTQLDVLLFDDMLGKTLSTTGESYSDLRDQKEELQKKFMQLGAKGLFDKLGIKVSPDGSTYVPNPTTLAKMLKEEAIARKWTDKDISELALKDVSGAVERVFKSPLIFNHARKNIDSLVLSLVNKAIIKIKIPGESLVQASSAGFEARGGFGWDQFVSSGELDKIKNGITLVETENAFDESVGLQGVRKGKDGKALPAQIFISPVLTDSNGNSVDLTSKKYTTITNGVRYLRTDILPQELRERILYRIPGQGKPSVVPVEIVGFLPKTSTASVIVPDQVIDQMGSDFDWDTAYTYFKQFEVNKDGTVKIKSDLSELQQLQDEYYELFKKIIFDETTRKATSKLDNNDLKQAADVVDGILGKESEINDPSFVTTNIDNTISQRTGKQLIGPASLAAVMHAALQGKNITINISSRTQEPIPFIFFKGGVENKNLKLTNISSYRGKSYTTDALTDAIRSASDNIRSVQNAAVDNANEAVLGRAGINNATIDVALFTLMYKDQASADSIHGEQLVYFLRQEAIEEYTKQVDYYSAQIEGGFRTEEQIRNDAFNASMFILAQKAGLDPEADYTTNLDQYRTTTDGEFMTFSSQEFLDQLRTKNKPNPSYYKTQMAILAGFKQLQNSSDPVRKLQRGIVSPRTKGIGSTIFEAQKRIDNMEAVFEKQLSTIGGVENLADGQLEEMYKQFSRVYTSLSEILPFSNRSHQRMINLWQQFTGNENVSQKLREDLFNSLLNKSFVRAFEKTFNEDATAARYRLLSDPDENIAARIEKVQESDFGRRNLFISRLLLNKPNKGVPASITYVNSKQDDIADQMAVDFVSLYESAEAGHRELFEDIVKYTYLTGGVQSSTNFSKFMNTAYLDQVGFYDALREEQKNLNSPTSPESINILELMVEYLQHNPNRAVALSRKELQDISVSPMRTIQFDGKTINYEFELPQPDNSNKFNRIVYQRDDGNLLYIEVIAAERPTGLELFQKIGVNKDGNVVFRRIGKKGYQTAGQGYSKVSEYSGVTKFLKDGRMITEESILPQNNIPKAVKTNVGIPQVSTTKAPTDISVYGLDPISMKYATPGRAGVKELLSAVMQDTQSKSLSRLATMLSKNIDTKGSAIKEILIEDGLVDRDGNSAYGLYRDGAVVINRETITRYPEKLQETILHELLHGFLSSEVADSSSEFSRKVSYLTNAANSAFKAAVKKGEIEEGTVQYKTLQYAFSNPQEFVTNTMTQKEVQSFLNTVPGKKNLFERFKQLIKDLLKVLGVDLGVAVNKDSLLAESVDSIMSFIVEAPARKQATKTAQKAEQEAGVFPLNPYISEPRHVLASYTRMKNGEYTQEEFDKALQDYRDSQLFSLNYMAANKNKTGRVIDEVLAVYQERADKLKGKLTDKVIKTAAGKKMQERLNVYRDQISTLKSKKTYGNLDSIMSLQLGWANGIANSKNPTEVEIKEALNIVDMYDYTKVTSKYLDKTERKVGDRFNELLKSQSSLASNIKVNLLDKHIDMTVEIINQELPETEAVTAEQLKNIEGETYRKSRFLDLSKFNHPVVRLLDKYLKAANRNADTDIQSRFLEIESAMADIQNSAAFKRDPNLFFQKDDKGKLTGYFISPYSSAYNQARGKILGKYRAKMAKATKDSAKNIATVQLMRDLDSIEFAIDVRWFIDEEASFNSPFKSKQEYMEYLDQQIGDTARRDALIKEALQKYKKYKAAEDQRMMEIELEESNNAGNIEEFRAAINTRQLRYKERYSPLYHLNSRYGGGKKLARNEGYKALVNVPLNKPKYYDSRYTAIQKDPQLKKFYDFYTSTMKDLITLLPEGLVATLPENFFPFAKRGFVEQIQSEGTSAIFSAMKGSKIADYLWNLDQDVTLNPQVATKGVRNPDTGEIEKNIPVRMLRGKADEKSYDIEKVMKMFAAMSVSYDYKSQVEDKILLLQRVIREAKEVQLDSTGSPMMRKINRALKLDSKVGGLKNTQDAVKYAIDSNLYGVTKDTVERGIVLSQKVAKVKQEFEQLQADYKTNKIDDSVYAEEKAKLDERLKELNEKPKSGRKVLERLVEYTQLKGLGWNLMSGINNLSFGTIANFVHAAGNEDYSTEQLTKAYALMFKEYVPGTANKAEKLAEKYGILFEQLDTYYGKTKKTNYKFMSKLNPFYLQTSTEYMNQIAPMVAKMLNTKIDDKGNTLWDMYDNEGSIKEEFKSLESDWTMKVDAETQNKFTEFRDATIEMNKVNHGNYDPNSALLIKKSVWGRIGTQFRTWAFEGLNTRWGGKVYNAQLGRYTEGRYMSFGKVGLKGSLEMFGKSILNTLTLGYGVSEESMRGDIKDDLTFANMRKNMAGLKFYLAVSAVGNLLRALGADEDDKETEKVYRLLQNTFYRLEQDGEFYASPGTTMEVLRNPAPVLKTVKDFSNAATATYDYIDDKEGYEESRRDPLNKKWMKVVPFGNSIRSIDYLMETQIEKD